MPIGCSNEEDCFSLSDGRWGRVLGVGVTHVAAGVWTVVLLAAARLASGVTGGWRSGAMQVVLWNLLAAGVLVAALAGVWFILLQTIVLRRWCRRCNLAHAGAFAGLAIVASLAPTGLPWLQLAGVATALVAIFITLQVFFPPAQFTVAPTPDARDGAIASGELSETPAARTTAIEAPRSVQPGPPTSTIAAHPQPTPRSAAPTPRSGPATAPAITVRLAGGRVALGTDTWPTLGNSSAPHVVALVMDYLCSDCLHMHRLLLEAVERSQGTLAILLLPVPMDPQTHPSLKPPKPPYDNPRSYARLAMALHHVSPNAFLTWDRHLITHDSAPLITDATAFARALIAPDDLDRALANPQIDATLREAAMWFITAGPMQVPKLLLPRSIVTGRIPDLSTLMPVINKEMPTTPRSTYTATSSPLTLSSVRASSSSRTSAIWSDQRIR